MLSVAVVKMCEFKHDFVLGHRASAFWLGGSPFQKV